MRAYFIGDEAQGKSWWEETIAYRRDKSSASVKEGESGAWPGALLYPSFYLHNTQQVG